MPINVIPAPVTAVMPSGLMQMFEFERRYEVVLNDYPDGRSTRQSLSVQPRGFARLTRMLTLAEYNALRTFYTANQTAAFYFYNLRETVPIGSYDPTGASATGRYAMVFDAPWTESIRAGRRCCTSDLALREVR